MEIFCFFVNVRQCIMCLQNFVFQPLMLLALLLLQYLGVFLPARVATNK